jgi:hypothetical protein
VADVVPTAPVMDRAAWIGSMRDTMKIYGDIIEPVIDLDDIEALHD